MAPIPPPYLKQPQSSPVVSAIAPSEQRQEVAENEVEQLLQKMKAPILGIDFTRTGRPRGASTHFITVSRHDKVDDPPATNPVATSCCGGGCSRLPSLAANSLSDQISVSELVKAPDNQAFRSLKLKLPPLTSRDNLSGTTPLPPQTISFEPAEVDHKSTVFTHPPDYVTPHPPWSVFSAKIDGVRELTKPGAIKRTYHFDLDVTNYPQEMPGVDFRVGGAIGVVAPNDSEIVAEIFEALCTTEAERDVPITLHTQGGRWPTIWGEEQERSMITTRRELLTWTVDVHSQPTKNLIRLLAEHAKDEDEKTILFHLCSKQGQAAFCE